MNRETLKLKVQTIGESILGSKFSDIFEFNQDDTVRLTLLWKKDKRLTSGDRRTKEGLNDGVRSAIVSNHPDNSGYYSEIQFTGTNFYEHCKIGIPDSLFVKGLLLKGREVINNSNEECQSYMDDNMESFVFKLEDLTGLELNILLGRFFFLYLRVYK